MRFRIRTAVVETSLYIKYYNVNINALSNNDGGSGKLIVYKVLKVNINALSNKDGGSGKLIVYKVL
jgi:hypothetical protein